MVEPKPAMVLFGRAQKRHGFILGYVRVEYNQVELAEPLGVLAQDMQSLQRKVDEDNEKLGGSKSINETKRNGSHTHNN